MVESTAKLRQEIMALTGVDIMDGANQFKSTYQIMEELANKWQDLTDIQQASVTELIAGKRQGNIVSSLMTNFDIAQNALKTSLGSEGSAMAEHAKYMDSIEAKLSQLKAAWQSFSQTFMSSDFLKKGIDILRELLETLEMLIDNFGVLGTIGLGTGIYSLFKSFTSGKGVLGEVVEAASNVVDITSVLGKTADGASGGVTKLFGSFGKLAGSALKFVGIAGAVAAAVGLVYNAYKKSKEEAAADRQETIENSDAYLEAAKTFEQAYIKYSGKTDLTAEEEAELGSAIQGTIDALGDKSGALQSAVNSSDDYLASLERIKNAEVEAAKEAAEAKKKAAEKTLKESAIGWESFDGSEVNVKLGTGKASKVALGMDSDFINTEATSKRFNMQKDKSVTLRLSGEADTKEIIEYYNFLKDYQEELKSEDLVDTSEYKKVEEAIGKISESIEVYTTGVYEAAKANYQLTEGIPKTTEEYIKMREAILSSEEISDYSFDAKMGILNNLDSEYSQLFDLSSVEAQARKFIGIIKGYGDGTKDGTNEIGTVETFLNMRTAVNNNECTVGQYLSELDNVKAMTYGWSDEEKEEFNLSFGIDTDSIKEQYNDVYNYISRNYLNNLDTSKYHGLDKELFKEEELRRVKGILDNLSATELTAVANIKAEIDWSNTNTEDILKQIKEEAKLVEALNFEADIEIDTTALETLNTALAESASAMGLSSEAIDSLKAKYSELDGYDASTLFERTANGVKVNREELSKLERQYNDLNKSEVQKHLDTLANAYNDVTAEIDKCTNAGERAELLSKREMYANQIEELATYQAQLEGVTGAYQKWIDAQSGSEDYEGYESIATGRENIEDELSRGFIGNVSKAYIDLLSGEDLDGKSIDDYANAWERLDDKVTGAGYSINDFFTVNDDGDITATGIDNFFKSLQTDFKGSVANFNSETKKWQYDFSQENLKKIQDEWGIGIEAIELLLEAAVSAGYDIDWDGILDGLDLDTSNFETLLSYAESAQEAFNKLEFEDVDFNFTATGVEEATSEIEKAHSIYTDLITDDDGSINLKAEGAEQMRVILSTLLIQKQQLEDSTIAINIDTSQLGEAEADIAAAIDAVATLREKYKNLEIAVTTGQGIEEAKTELSTALTELQGIGDTGIDIAAQLILGEGTDGETLSSKVDAAISAAGSKDIKVGCKLDETAIGTLNSQILTNFTPEATVKITGIDDTLVGEYTATEKTANGKVKWTNDDSLVVEFQNKNHSAKGTVNWGNNVEKVKTSFSASGTVKWTSGNNVKVDVVSEAKGTANANGTVGNSGHAFARGNWGIKGNGVALGGELGQELVVRDGKFFTIGDDGAEFFRYKKNDIVFNAAQTESLFKYGGIKGANPRGKMLASGSAFVEGNAFAWSASGSESNWASNRQKDGIKTTTTKTEKETTTTTTTIKSSGLPSSSSSSPSSRYGSIAKFDSSSGTPSPYFPSTSSSSSSSSSSKDEKEFEETLDWIETKIKRIERAIDQLDQKANNIYNSWSSRNEALVDEISKVEDEIKIQQDAYERYMEEAEKVGLDESWAEKVRNGKIDIETITDEGLNDKISKYKEYYEAALDCKDAIEELKETEASLYQQRLENVVTEYEGVLGVIEHEKSMLEEYINQAEAQSWLVSAKYYDALAKNERETIAELENQKAEMLAEFNAAMDSDTIVEGSEAWHEMVNSIDEVTLAIAESETQLLEYQQTIQQLKWETFDLLQEKISAITEETEFLIELMSSDKLFDDKGQLTDEGKATMGLHGQAYNTYMYQADLVAEEIEKLKAQMAEDPYDTELEERYREMIALQQEYILSAQSEKEAIRDLVSEGIEYELEALQELIDKKNEQLQSEKDLYEYSKKVKEQTKEIASLEKQMAAYSGDNSEEAQQKIQQIKVELESAKDELQETEYDKFISDSATLLDELYLEYETLLNTRLDNLDYLVEQMIAEINADAVNISETLSAKADEVGYTLTESMKAIWDKDSLDTRDVITTYGDKFLNAQTTTHTALNLINTNLQNMIAQLNKIADTKTSSAKKSSAAKSSTKNTTTQKASTTKSSGGDGKPKIGDRVKYISGQYYYDSQGKKPLGSHKQGEYVYITNINEKDWATHGYHISTGNKLGKGDLGWLKLNQISGYATGKKNFSNNEIAWTQENGQEYIIRPSDGAILTPIAKSDSILNSVASGNLWDMANNPAEFIRGNLESVYDIIPTNSNVHSNYTQHFDEIVFNFPNVKNYNEMLTEMQKDPKFEKLILSMSIDQLAGKSSLAKNKSIR